MNLMLICIFNEKRKQFNITTTIHKFHISFPLITHTADFTGIGDALETKYDRALYNLLAHNVPSACCANTQDCLYKKR